MSEDWKEKRKLFRKNTNLEGYYWKHTSQSALAKIEKAIVLDLSAGGCRLSVSNDHDLHLNDSITLTFRLGNAERTKLQKETVVCRVDGNYISCKFSLESDKDIWSYLHSDIAKDGRYDVHVFANK